MKSNLRALLLAGAMSASFAVFNSFGASSVAQTPAAAAPFEINAMLRAYGINEANSAFRFSRREINGQEAVFHNVHFGSDFSASKMTLHRESAGNRNEFVFDDIRTASDDGEVRAQRLIFRHNQDPRALNSQALAHLFSMSGEEETRFAGDLVVTNLRIPTGDKDDIFQFGGLTINGAQVDDKGFKFTNLIANDFETNASNMIIKVGQIDLAGLSDAVFENINKKDDEEDTPRSGASSKPKLPDNWRNFSFDLVKVQSVSIKPASASARRARPGAALSFEEFKIANFETRNFNANTVGRFAIQGISLRAAMSRDPIRFDFGELSFDKLKLQYLLAAAGELENTPDLAGLRQQKISDFMSGGPLDNIVDSFKIAGLNIEAMGAEVRLDQLGMSFEKDANGIITKASVPRGGFTMKVKDRNKTAGIILSRALDSLGVKELSTSWEALATYDKVNDRTIYDKTDFSINEIMGFNFNGVFNGFGRWQTNKTVGDMLDFSNRLESEQGIGFPRQRSTPVDYEYQSKKTRVQKVDYLIDKGAEEAVKGFEKIAMNMQKEPSARATPMPDARTRRTAAERMAAFRTFFDEMSGFYGGISASNYSFAVRDLGIFTRLATVQAAEQGSTAAQIRQTWRGRVMRDADKPDISIVGRSIITGLGDFMLNGGRFVMESTPNATPIDIARFRDQNATPQQLGIFIGVRPNAASSPTPPAPAKAN